MNKFSKDIKSLVDTSMNCKFLVKLFGVVETSDSMNLVREFVPLGSLDRVLNGNQPSDEMKIKILWDVARGMEYLHSKKITHRDLKPENILCTEANDPRVEANCK